MRRNHSDAGGRTESSTDLIARITAERESRTAETTTRTAPRPAPRTTNAPQTPRPAPQVDSTTQVDTTRTIRTTRVAARPAGRHSSPDAADAAETRGEPAVTARLTQRVPAQPLGAADIEQDQPAGDAGPDDRDFSPAPGSPRRSRRGGRPISRRLAPLAV